MNVRRGRESGGGVEEGGGTAVGDALADVGTAVGNAFADVGTADELVDVGRALIGVSFAVAVVGRVLVYVWKAFVCDSI